MTNQNLIAAHQKGLEGNQFFEQAEYVHAISAYQEALQLHPEYPEIYFNLGLAYQALFQFEIAVLQFEQAIQINPNYVDAYIQRGNVLRDLQQLQLAKLSYETALSIDERSTQALNNLGVVHYELRQIPEAIIFFQRAIKLDENHINAHWGLSLCYLLMGQFDQGWQEFEWRLKDQEFTLKTFPHEYEQYLWKKGDQIAGKTILLMAEQGLGDTIQFCRFAKALKSLDVKVVLQVPQVLVKLLRCVEGVDQVISDHESAQDIDLVIPLMSLPHRLDLKEHHLGFDSPYISIPKNENITSIQQEESKKIKVGLVWQGGIRASLPSSWATHQRRNIPLEMYTQFENPQIDFYSLQKGTQAIQELIELKKSQSSFIVRESSFDDFFDTAKIVNELDLVITVDTAVAHLAAAMGKPVWIINRFDACWRWLLSRHDTPWYPSVRLYFQTTPGDWQTVIDDVKRDLQQFISGNR